MCGGASEAMSFLIILIVLTIVFAGCTEFKKHVPNSVYPFDVDPPTYNIEHWVKLLHLQQCAFVEVGDKYYAVFVETRPRMYDKERQIREYFLGVCDEDTLSKWSFCPANLQAKRSADCDFLTYNMYGTRVHRRLCDVTHLSLNAPQCDCNSDLSDSKLFKVQGFPTCFKAPLPDSLCGDNNVCGLAACKPETVNKRIHSVVCDPECHHRQPFCEQPDKKSSQPREIRSYWTDWSNPFCTDVSCLSQFDEATCINRLTGDGDIDCLGPGTSCCPADLQNCRCHIYEEEGAAKVFRTFSIPPPELVEYMSEEDFINSIPLRYLNKEEFHKYPYYSPRTVRANPGKTMKKVILKLYEHRPLKFGNTHGHGKNGFKRLSTIKRRVIQRFKTKRDSVPRRAVKARRSARISRRKMPKVMIEETTIANYLNNDEFCRTKSTTTTDSCKSGHAADERGVKLENYNPNDDEFCGHTATTTTQKPCDPVTLKNATKRECNFTVGQGGATSTTESKIREDDREMAMAREDSNDSLEEELEEGQNENDEIVTEAVTDAALELNANITVYTRLQETEDDDGNPTTAAADNSELTPMRRKKNIIIEVNVNGTSEDQSNATNSADNSTKAINSTSTTKLPPLDAENEDYDDFPKAKVAGECNQGQMMLSKVLKFFRIPTNADCDGPKSSFKRGIEDVSDDDDDEDDDDILIEYIDGVTTSTTTESFEKGDLKNLNVDVDAEAETSTERNSGSGLRFNFIVLFLIYF